MRPGEGRIGLSSWTVPAFTTQERFNVGLKIDAFPDPKFFKLIREVNCYLISFRLVCQGIIFKHFFVNWVNFLFKMIRRLDFGIELDPEIENIFHFILVVDCKEFRGVKSTC